METLNLDPALSPFPTTASHTQLVGYVDASHGNDLCHQRSTTGYAFMLAGSAIAYQSKTQTITVTSSTEAEIIAAVSSAKDCKAEDCKIPPFHSCPAWLCPNVSHSYP
jgi:hypothetical protein